MQSEQPFIRDNPSNTANTYRIRLFTHARQHVFLRTHQVVGVAVASYPICTIHMYRMHNAGDTVEILPGDRFSVDGVIITGCTAADESSLTGEPIPVPKGPGDAVRAGTSSAGDGGAVRVKATATGARSVLASVIALVEDAQVGLRTMCVCVCYVGISLPENGRVGCGCRC